MQARREYKEFKAGPDSAVMVTLNDYLDPSGKKAFEEESIEEVKEKIYEHISRENEMGLPPHESWEGIMEGEEWVDECIESG